MAEEVSKNPNNVPGKYYVEGETCCAFGLCAHHAPRNFVLPTDAPLGLGAYVFRQPQTPEEEMQCQEALRVCPVAVIHDDGEAQGPA